MANQTISRNNSSITCACTPTQRVMIGAMGGLVAGMVFGMMMNMPNFHFDTMAWQSLMGHVVFGVVLGALTVAIPSKMHK